MTKEEEKARNLRFEPRRPRAHAFPCAHVSSTYGSLCLVAEKQGQGHPDAPHLVLEAGRTHAGNRPERSEGSDHRRADEYRAESKTQTSTKRASSLAPRYPVGRSPERTSLLTCTTQGLMSALLVTITWPYFFDLQDYDFSEFEDRAEIHEGILMTTFLAATASFMLSTIHSVITMCIAGVLTRNVEAVYFGLRR
eukprot:6187942-Prymnesium_polylepis.3